MCTMAFVWGTRKMFPFDGVIMDMTSITDGIPHTKGCVADSVSMPWRHHTSTTCSQSCSLLLITSILSEFLLSYPYYFFKYSCTNIFHRRSLYTFYEESISMPWPTASYHQCQNDQRRHTTIVDAFIMTSSNGNIFRVTGHLCGEFTCPRWIPRTKASDSEFWCFLWSRP